MKFIIVLLTAAAILVGSAAESALAQGRPRVAVEVEAGPVFFADDGVVTETMFGGSGRVYLTPRIAVGPELFYIAGSNHSHFVLTGNLTFDFITGSAGSPARITPFVTVGGGVFQTRDQYPFNNFTSTEGAFTAGGGVRGSITDGVYVGAEARIGWETHVRVNAFVGWRF